MVRTQCTDMVSVIVPVYNAETYLQTCIDSILGQTYPHLELILVNDGSKDSSLEICQRYSKADNRIVILDQVNQGASLARYNGLQIAKGSYISFVDSDDWIDTRMLETAVRVLQEKNADVFVFDYEVNGTAQGNWNATVFDSTEQIMTAYFAGGGLHNKLYNKLVKAALYRHVQFPSGRDVKEDACIMAQVLSLANCVVRTDEIFYHYRMVENSLSRKKKYTHSEFAGASRNELDKLFIVWDFLPRQRQEIVKQINAVLAELLYTNTGFYRYGIQSAVVTFYDKYREEIDILPGGSEWLAAVSLLRQGDYSKIWLHSFLKALLPGKNHNLFLAARMIKNGMKKS